MSLTTSALVVRIIGIIWICTLLNSLLIMIGGGRLFKRALASEKTAYYPIINLFSLMEISDVSTFFGILLFIPGFNVLVSAYTFYKLGCVFNMGGTFKIGLVILPVIFYPLLAFGNYRYKATDEKYFRAIDDARGQRRNLMMELEENRPDTPFTVTDVKEEKTEEVDSVFKTNFKQSEEAAPYKAVRIDAFGMERLKEDGIDEDVFKPKIKATPSSESQPSPESKPEEKKDDFEVIDL